MKQLIGWIIAFFLGFLAALGWVFLIWLGLILAALPAGAQNRFPHINIVNTLPSGSCASVPANTLEQYNGDLYTCDPNTHLWRILAGSQTGSGNPGGPSQSQQINASGVLGGSANATLDLNGNATQVTTTSSVNKVISVIAPPYNAKCDGATVDTTAIQAAFTAAQSGTQTVEFPAGTCVTGKITYYGQSFFGAGKNQTFIKGLPGQDVFQVPDSNVSLGYAPHIRDLTIQVDNTVNAAATAAGGNNTFPNRIFGTAGGTTPLASAYGGPPAPGPQAYNSATSGSCGVSISSGSNVLTIPCGGFFNEPIYYTVGGTVTVNGAGPAGGTLTTTVSNITSGSTLILAANASTTVTNAQATVASAARVQPPWYCGNAGIAIPASSGANMSGPNGWTLSNVQFQIVNGPNIGNNVCAFFLQAAPNAMNFEHVDVQSFYGGIIEAPPATNNSSYFAWTNDTATYDDVNLKFNLIPMTWINGGHRKVGIMSIYGGNIPYTMGLWQFSVPLGTSGGIPSASWVHYYDECWTNNSGEHARFSGNGDQILGGSLGQCNGTSYVTLLASYSNINTAPAGTAGGTSIAIENRGSNNQIGLPAPTYSSPCGLSYYPAPPGTSCYYDKASPISQSIDLPTSFSGSQIIGPLYQWQVIGGTLPGGNLNPVVTTFALNLKSALSTSPTIGVICDGTTIATMTPTLTTTNTWYYLTADMGTCVAGGGFSGNAALTFGGGGFTQTMTLSGIQVFQAPIAQPQPSSDFQVPVSKTIAGTRYYEPSSLKQAFGASYAGVPPNAQVMAFVPITAAFNIPSSCTGSFAGAQVAATGTAAFTAKKHAGGPGGTTTTLCTFTFSASGTTAAVSGSGGSLADGDYIEIDAPATADATLATIGIGIGGTKLE